MTIANSKYVKQSKGTPVHLLIDLLLCFREIGLECNLTPDHGDRILCLGSFEIPRTVDTKQGIKLPGM